MVETKERGTGKPRLETLSDLIFGLALSIGALTLIGQPPTSFEQLLVLILFYAFSFFILITVWIGYTRTMSLIRIEAGSLVTANVLLLFLVSIEPFLFNQLFQGNASYVENVSVLYALDLGGLFLIQAVFANAVLSNKNDQSNIRYGYKLRRNTFLISSGFFFASTLPFFWNWSLTLGSGIGVPIRVVMWLIPLALPSARRLWERRNKTKLEG